MPIVDSLGAPLGDGGAIYPVSPQNPFGIVHADAKAADNGTSRILDPYDSGFDARWIDIVTGTTLLLAMRHTASGTLTGPNANVFGRDQNGVIIALVDASGNVDIPIAGDNTTDMHQDATPVKVTPIVQIDLLGQAAVLICVKDVVTATTSVSFADLIGKVI